MARVPTSELAGSLRRGATVSTVHEDRVRLCDEPGREVCAEPLARRHGQRGQHPVRPHFASGGELRCSDAGGVGVPAAHAYATDAHRGHRSVMVAHFTSSLLALVNDSASMRRRYFGGDAAAGGPRRGHLIVREARFVVVVQRGDDDRAPEVPLTAPVWFHHTDRPPGAVRDPVAVAARTAPRRARRPVFVASRSRDPPGACADFGSAAPTDGQADDRTACSVDDRTARQLAGARPPDEDTGLRTSRAGDDVGALDLRARLGRRPGSRRSDRRAGVRVASPAARPRVTLYPAIGLTSVGRTPPRTRPACAAAVAPSAAMPASCTATGLRRRGRRRRDRDIARPVVTNRRTRSRMIALFCLSTAGGCARGPGRHRGERDHRRGCSGHYRPRAGEGVDEPTVRVSPCRRGAATSVPGVAGEVDAAAGEPDVVARATPRGWSTRRRTRCERGFT